MLDITIIAVGKLKEKFYLDACGEYVKRLGAYCKIAVAELPESKKENNMEYEADAILAAVPKGAYICAMCVEGEEMTSEQFSAKIEKISAEASKIAFIIGGSDGLSPRVKSAAKLRMSMSRMTLPHHLARVMLLEQIYRAMNISFGGKYHK